ncbi:MAG: type II secretion system F family protein [Candidatus Methanoperedens sp.]|nr:type II secretion system F family protein [Candidatus Methanoperedens sp.]
MNVLKKIFIRYKIKREFFILLIPALIAIMLIVVYMLPAGDEKKQNIEYTPEDAPVNINKSLNETAAKQSQGIKITLDQVIVFAVLITITPYSVDVYLDNRRKRRYEQEFIGFLYELSELLRGGLDPLNALTEIASPAVESEQSLNTLAPHLRKAAAQIAWGVSFENVISSMADSLKSPLISKYGYLIVQASKLGAISPAIILKAADDLEKTLQLEREKEAELKEFIMIIYAAEFILIGIIYLLNNTLLPSILDMVKEGSGAAFGISSIGMDIAAFKRGFFHVIMINAFASGIIAGQISEGKARHGLKHSIILMILGYIASLAFLLD